MGLRFLTAAVEEERPSGRMPFLGVVPRAGRIRRLCGWMAGRLLLGWLVAFGSWNLRAQDRPGDSPSQGSPAAPQRLYFSALGGQEIPILGLEAGDFALRLGERPIPLTNFKAGREHASRATPVVAWILVDFNPRIDAALFASQAEGAAAAFDQMHPSSALGVKLITDRTETLVPLGHHADQLRQAFRDLRTRRSQLKVYRADGTSLLGVGGLVRAAELALAELDEYLRGQPELAGKEVLRSILILSDANINLSYSRRALIELAAGQGASIYPVFIPRTTFGRLAEEYFQLGRQTGGVGLVFGAIRPRSDLLNLGRVNRDANALLFSIMNLLRDMLGKYSFTMDAPQTDRPLRLDLRCLRSGISIRLPRRQWP